MGGDGVSQRGARHADPFDRGTAFANFRAFLSDMSPSWYASPLPIQLAAARHLGVGGSFAPWHWWCVPSAYILAWRVALCFNATTHWGYFDVAQGK